MVQIYEDVPSGKSQFLNQLFGGAQQGFSGAMDFAQKMALEKAKRKTEDQSLAADAQRAITDMRDIVAKGNTGLNLFGFLKSEGRADRAALDTAALNIERLAADMVGKGTLSRERFKYLTRRLPSSGKTDAENNAILDEWEKIVGETEIAQPKKTKKSKKAKFNIANPEHKAKRDQLLKTYKNDKEKVREILLEEFEE